MNGAAVRPRWPAGVGVAVVLAALAFALALGGWTWRADRLVYDIGLSFWRRPVPEGIVIVAIDDASVAAIGRWPWPRAVHSTLLARLAAARPRAIGLDVTFSEPDADPAQDALLARQLAAAAPVVMSVDWVIAGPGQTPQLLAPVTGLPPGVSLGTAEASVDADGVMRHAFLGAGPAAAPLPHMALALLRAGGETPAPGLPVAVQDEQVPVAGRAPWLRQERFLVRYAGPPGHIERVSYLDVLRGAVPPERLAGRYVLVGMTATGLGDTVATPVNRQHHAMPGVEVLAHTLHTLRSGDTVRPLSPLEGATLSAALVLALLAGIERLGAGRGALVLAVGSVPLVVGISLAALGAGVWWSPVPWGLAAVLAYPLWSWRRLQQAVDALDAEIGLLGPEAGLSPGAPVPLPSRRRDALALRLDALHAATDTVRSARRFLSDALAGLPTAMAVTDERGRVLLANALAAQVRAQSPASHGRHCVIHLLDQKVHNLNPDYFSYTVSKLALERSVALQAQALAPQVRVCGLSPGLMYLSGPQTQANFDRASRVNLLQQPIDPAAVARAAVFIAENTALNGCTLQADNGQHLVPLARDVMFAIGENPRP